VLTAHDNPSYIRQMVAAGADGYLLKEEALDVVVQAIRTVMEGGQWFSESILPKLVQAEQAEESRTREAPSLSEQELTMLRLLVAGRTDQEIGEAMGFAERTVRYHLRNIYDKLSVNTRIEAAVRAVQSGLIEPS
ncbi:MAG: response regulator transcription factor, partial [Chloroflexota bacterium]|nr:response regulator transcription factor [Chloroflexota bacterium]